MRNRLSRALPLAAALAVLSAAGLPATAATAPATGAAAVTASQDAATADDPSYIVTVHPGLDPAAVAEAHGVTPLHVYRHALNGFAARLTPEQVEALRAAAPVESVQEDGAASSGDAR